MLIVSVDGNEIKSDVVMNSVMGFGQGSSDGRTPNEYSLLIDFETLKSKLFEVYDNFIEMDKGDDEEVDEDYPELQTLRDLNHPSLDELLKDHPDLLAELISNHFPVEFLSCLFPTSDEEIKDRQFNINSIKVIEVQADKLKVYGDIFPIEVQG